MEYLMSDAYINSRGGKSKCAAKRGVLDKNSTRIYISKGKQREKWGEVRSLKFARIRIRENPLYVMRE